MQRRAFSPPRAPNPALVWRTGGFGMGWEQSHTRKSQRKRLGGTFPQCRGGLEDPQTIKEKQGRGVTVRLPEWPFLGAQRRHLPEGGKVHLQNAELFCKGEALRMGSPVLLLCDATCSYKLTRPWNMYLGDSCGGEEEACWTERGPASRPDFPDRSPDLVMQIWLERCIGNGMPQSCTQTREIRISA